MISRVFGGWRSDDKTLWNKFALLNKDVPGKGGCGNIHFPVNGISDYDYANSTTVSSSCDDWYNYPNFKNVTTQVNCQTWGCNQWGYMKWWYTHLPYISGLNNGYLNNWWKYITNPEEYKDKGNFLSTTATPSHDFTKDPLTSWQCSAVNGTCDVFDETTQKLSGVKSIKYITDSGYDTQVSYATTSGTLNIGSQKYLTFWVYAVNTNDNPIFETNSPIIYLKDKAGNSIKYQPGQSVLDQAVGKWTQFIIPLDGDGIWQKTTNGTLALSDVNKIEIHADTWGYGFNLFFDGLGFADSLVNNPDTTAPYVNITYPQNNALIPQIATASAEATDSSKISRVDFLRFLVEDRAYPEANIAVETVVVKNLGAGGKNKLRADVIVYDEPAGDLASLPSAERLARAVLVAEIKRDTASKKSGVAHQLEPALMVLPRLDVMGIYWDAESQVLLTKSVQGKGAASHVSIKTDTIANLPNFGDAYREKPITVDTLTRPSRVVGTLFGLEHHALARRER
jgi:hypothetical protein